VGADGLGCGIIRRTKTRLGWKCRPERAAFFLRVAKDEMQWQRYEAAPTLFVYSRIAARFLAVARACHVNSVAILSRDLRTSSRTRRCRFRKLHPIDSRSAANQNMIVA
jgi:hypothetical protein